MFSFIFFFTQFFYFVFLPVARIQFEESLFKESLATYNKTLENIKSLVDSGNFEFEILAVKLYTGIEVIYS